MRTFVMLVAVLPLVVTPSASAAQADHDGHESPYVELQDRAIKALSQEEVRALREGEGMGFALAAELNGYPGPKHVLEMAAALDMTREQIARVTVVYREMNERARRLGTRLVQAERDLDRAFAEASVDASRLATLVREAGAVRTELRLAHLEAHLEVTSILDRDQVHRYRDLRGYDSGRARPHGAHGS